MRFKSLSIITSLMLLLMLVPFYMQASPVAAEGPTDADGAGTLTLLHNNDGESGLLATTNTVSDTEVEVGSVAAFKTVMDEQIAEGDSAGNAVVSVYAGDAFLASATLACSLSSDDAPVYDAIAQRQMDYDAHILGNHEFDYSPDYLKRFIEAFDDGSGLTQPFLSSNLDFSGEASFADLVDADGLIDGAVTDGRVIAHSLIMTDANQRVAIVGATTPELPNISSPRNVDVMTTNLTDTAALVQTKIDDLYDNHGIRKIIFVSHLQSVDNDEKIIGMLSKVDVAVAGGGDELLVNPALDNAMQLLPGEGDEPVGDYPKQVADKDGRTVYLVTTKGNYKYLGRLDVEFDGEGEVSSINSEMSYPRRVVPTSDAATTLGLMDAVAMDANLVTSVNTPVEACLQDLETSPVAQTEVLLNVDKPTVRSKESNAGNMIADSFIYMYEKYSNTLRTAGSEPVIALQNGGGIRQNAGDILPTTGMVPGNITQRNTIDVLPFNNLLSVIKMVTPTDLKSALELAASSLPSPDGQFMQIAGLKVTYNVSNATGSRVMSVILDDGTKIVEDGALVDGAPNVTVLTNNFVARGGDGYTQFANNSNQNTLRDTSGTFIYYERAWREYLQSLPTASRLDGESGELPTISASDTRYQPGGEGRITIEEEDPTAVSLTGLSTNSTTVPMWPFALGLLAGSLGLLALRRQTR